MKGGGTQCTEFVYGSLLSGRSKSAQRRCGPSQYSKPYVMFSVTDAASAAIDFSKKDVNDGVVDSPPSRGPWRSPVLSGSPLQGSPCVGHWHRSPSRSPLRSPSRTPHRQLYKRCMGEGPLLASGHFDLQCVSAPVCALSHDIHPRCPVLDDLRVEDNQPSISSAEKLPLQSIIETEVVGARCEHPHLEDTRQLLTSFCSDVQHVVGPEIPRPTHSHEVVPLQQRSIVRSQLQATSLGSGVPLRRSKSSYATCKGSPIGFSNHIPMRATSLTCRKKRRENESFLDWFSRQTNSESLGYTSLRQEDILRAFSKKKDVDAKTQGIGG